MSLLNQKMLSCSNCGVPFQAEVDQLLDAGEDPNAKSRLISGRVNVVTCPNCGFEMQVASPLMYHDPAHELLLVHVPMELGMSQDQQEQFIGQLLRKLTESLPQDQRKGYLLNPRRTFTLQGMIDTVLEKEGITKEMLASRQQKLRLVETLLQTPPDQLEALVEKHNDDLDEEFFSILTVTAESAIANGQQQMGEQIIALRDAILPYSTYGQEVLNVARRQEEAVERLTREVKKMGDDVSHRQLAELAAENGEDEDYLQVFASMMRPVMDYQFFTELADIIENHRNKKLRRKAKMAREVLVGVLEIIDQQNQQAVQQAYGTLESILSSGNIEAALRQNIAAINDMFMAVLGQALQDAEQQGAQERLQKLQQVRHAVNELIMQNSPPEVRLINELLVMEDDLELRLRLVDEAPQFGERLVQYLDALIQQLSERGEAAILQRLEVIRAEAAKVLELE